MGCRWRGGCAEESGACLPTEGHRLGRSIHVWRTRGPTVARPGLGCELAETAKCGCHWVSARPAPAAPRSEREVGTHH